MTVREESIGSSIPAGRHTAPGRRLAPWVPAVLLFAAVAGAVAVWPSVSHDQSAHDWYRGRLGGSALYTLDVVFARLLPFLIVGGAALALLQRRLRRRQAVAAGGALRRHEPSEVFEHWLNAAGIGLGLITAVWLRRWFHNPLSLETTYLLHFIGAGLTVAAVTHHLTYELVGGGAGLLPRRRADFKNALAEIVGYTGVYRGMRGAFGVQLPRLIRRPLQRVLRALHIVPDPSGKYLATEKVLSYTIWTVLIGLIVITGIVKTLHYIVAMPAGLRQTMTFLHDGATIFLIVFLGIHVGALVLVPRNWPLLKSMVTTRISREYAQRHLPLWQEEQGDKS